MIPPRCDGCGPMPATGLATNEIHLHGNAFAYMVGPGSPRVIDVTAGREVRCAWSFESKAEYPAEGVGGSLPSTMTIWIERVEPGHTYLVKFSNWEGEFVAGPEVEHKQPPPGVLYVLSPRWYQRLWKWLREDVLGL